MGTRLRIMGLEVDLLTRETFQESVEGFLSEDGLNVIYMISLDFVGAYEENELVREVLGQADLILPGEKAILSAHHVDVLETGGMFVDYRSFIDFSGTIGLEDKKFYFILRDDREARVVRQYFERHFPEQNCLGIFVADENQPEEMLVNDINTKLPDILFLSMDSTGQEEWIANNKSRLNARLCVVCGSILPLMIRDNVHIPGWIRCLHLGRPYRFFARIPYLNFFRKRIFKRQMDDYITKKKLEGNQSDDGSMERRN